MTWQLVVLAVFILLSALFAQQKHYEYLDRKAERDMQKDIEKELKLNSEFSNVLKELKEMKTKVDTLTLKAGFKL